MNLMINMFQDCLNKFVEISIDDILIYTKIMEEHKDHMRIFLQCLKEKKLFGKLSKCSFYRKEINYLGHILSVDGIIVDLENIKAILE